MIEFKNSIKFVKGKGDEVSLLNDNDVVEVKNPAFSAAIQFAEKDGKVVKYSNIGGTIFATIEERVFLSENPSDVSAVIDSFGLEGEMRLGFRKFLESYPSVTIHFDIASNDVSGIYFDRVYAITIKVVEALGVWLKSKQ